MSSSAHYRRRAIAVARQAESTPDDEDRKSLHRLAQEWLDLAEKAAAEEGEALPVQARSAAG